MRKRRRKWIAGICLAVAAGVLGVSCDSVKYYAQAVRGQQQIFHLAKPIDTVVQDPGTDESVRQRLKLVQEMRKFASSDLHLPAEKQYDRYTDLKRQYVTWVVFAAPEFSTKGHTWSYPFVGDLEYRGYFDQEDAAAEAKRLAKEGYDVYAGGVEAFSTLGWFRDPVLNTFFRRDDADLAELLFHELAHQRVFISGDTDFNEAFATTVGQEGARRWLKHTGRDAELRQYERELRATREFVEMAFQTRDQLEKVYALNHGLPESELRQKKQAAFEDFRKQAMTIKDRWPGTLAIDKWFAKPVNNARLNTLTTYHELAPGFEALLHSVHNDLDAFYEAVEDFKKLSEKERKEKLKILEAAAQ